MKKIIAALLVMCSLLLLCSCEFESEEPRGVRMVEINEKGELIIIFTDGTTTNVGVVKGEKGDAGENGADGQDGVDGKDGKDGKDGEDGKDGAKGEQGIMGIEGRDGRSIESITTDAAGNLVITYSDEKTETVELMGALYLFGGFLNGEGTAAWALYNGGLLVIGGEGETNDYKAGDAPWTAVIPMVAAVYVDTSNGLQLDTDLLSGIDPSIIKYSSGEQTTTVWVDKAVEAPIYDSPEKIGDENATPLEYLKLGETMQMVTINDEYATIIYNGGYAYIAEIHVRDNPDSVVFSTPSDFTQIRVTGNYGADLRWYPDVYSDNKYTSAPIPNGTVLNCDGISQNEWWYRVSYNGERLYVYKSVVTPIISQE